MTSCWRYRGKKAHEKRAGRCESLHTFFLKKRRERKEREKVGTKFARLFFRRLLAGPLTLFFTDRRGARDSERSPITSLCPFSTLSPPFPSASHS